MSLLPPQDVYQIVNDRNLNNVYSALIRRRQKILRRLLDFFMLINSPGVCFTLNFGCFKFLDIVVSSLNYSSCTVLVFTSFVFLVELYKLVLGGRRTGNLRACYDTLHPLRATTTLLVPRPDTHGDRRRGPRHHSLFMERGPWCGCRKNNSTHRHQLPPVLISTAPLRLWKKRKNMKERKPAPTSIVILCYYLRVFSS